MLSSLGEISQQEWVAELIARMYIIGSTTADEDGASPYNLLPKQSVHCTFHDAQAPVELSMLIAQGGEHRLRVVCT